MIKISFEGALKWGAVWLGLVPDHVSRLHGGTWDVFGRTASPEKGYSADGYERIFGAIVQQIEGMGCKVGAKTGCSATRLDVQADYAAPLLEIPELQRALVLGPTDEDPRWAEAGAGFFDLDGRRHDLVVRIVRDLHPLGKNEHSYLFWFDVRGKKVPCYLPGT